MSDQTTASAARQEPDPGRESAIARAVALFMDRQAQGEALDVETFCAEHAALLPELQVSLKTVLYIDDALESRQAAAPSRAEAAAVPERLSGHKVLSELGSGGMGRVLLAEDERLNRKVAIKVLREKYWPDIVLSERFMQEARAMAQLAHPNVAAIYSLGSAGEPPHFVMEYIQGVPLTEAAAPLHSRQKMELFCKVAMAVDFLHRHGVVHRDLKPGNVLVGADLEPKVLDFGLALRTGAQHLTEPGQVLGTRDYFSPEQARGQSALDVRSDVFSLGVILYQLLTGRLPFRDETVQEQLQALCQQEPVLPARIDRSIPGELQNVCLKALEKDPAERYGSARELADDLRRWLAGEPVLAHPAVYARLITGKVDQHLRELSGWNQDNFLSDLELDAFRRMYERLIEHEDAWIMQVRRLSLSQVTLYFGAWILVLAAALVVLFDYPALAGTRAVLIVGAATASTAWIGLRCWKQGLIRIGVAYLLTFCLLLPILLVVAMGQYGLLAAAPTGKENLEFLFRFDALRRTTNAQLWWSLALALPGYVWLRRFTRSFVFSLVIAVMGALLCVVTLLRMGLMQWVEDDPGRIFLYLLPFALIFFLLGGWMERAHHADDSRYFYFVGMAFTFAGLSGVALLHKPYADWLNRVAPWTRGQEEYLFIINAGIYLALQFACDRFHSVHLRWVGKSFRFVIPGHVLTSMLLLGILASQRWQESVNNTAMRHEARTFEFLLPLAACAFVFGSIPKQMKNFLATGLLFLAIGIVRLQQDFFHGWVSLPISLLVVGVLLMVAAANFPYLNAVAARVLGRFGR